MADQISAIEDHVTCSICMDLYDEPIALPCMHSFCRRCLIGIHSSSMVLKCPECRKDTKLGRGGVDSLPRNFQLGCIVDTYKKEHQVTAPSLPLCSEHRHECELLCETCKQSICVACISTKKHRGHSLKVSVKNVHVTQSDTDAEKLCGKHSRNIISYCTDCDELVCLECIVTTHVEHTTESVDVMYNQIMGTFGDTVSDLDSRHRLLKATQKSCRTMAQKVQIDSQRKYQELSVFFNRLRDSLDKREAALKQEIESREKSAVERYLTKAEQAAKKEICVADVINDVKRFLTEDKHQFLKNHTKTSERVSTMLVNEHMDSTPRVRGIDGVSLQTCSLEQPLLNVKWLWPDNDGRPVRKAPPIPAQRKSKSNLKSTTERTKSLESGCPVKRGQHWKDAMRDGGPGHVGIIVQLTVDPTVYLVRWPNGKTENYRYIPGLDEEITPA